jgi:DNA mismatch repair protein MutS
MTVVEIVDPFPLETALQKRLSGQVAATSAAETLFRHLRVQLKIEIPTLPSIPQTVPTMAIDRSTLHHLELVESLSPKTSLLYQIDSTETPMGGRLLRDWLQHPLLSLPAISARQNAVESLLTRTLPLEGIRDLERLIGKISSSYATPRDLLALGLSLTRLPPLRSVAVNSPSPLIRASAQEIGDLSAVTHKILASLVESPPMRIGDGEIFRDGIHVELDRLRTLAKDSLQWMANYQTTLRDQTGIKTLKVSFTRAFGYYIEVTLAQRDRVPATFQRRQTLTNGERFTTDELKRFETQILTAEEKGKALETELFETLRREVALSASLIRQSARAIAQLDALASLAAAARRHRWVRPQVEESSVLEIRQGRHPVLESLLGSAHFIPNDTLLSPPQSQLMLITGPNMAGKSTYLRQVALIAILAQIGSFVPAQSARIGLIDKIFSRIGASDDLARGQSTFMVEMTETAQILANATSRSLVLLDEVGRGTSTYDGIAIAWSVAEYLLSTPDRRAKTLFATHYSELTQLESMWEGAINYQVAVEETDSGVAFLRTIVPGAARKSYGIHVAKLAGLPPKAIQRAQELLTQLEKSKPQRTKKEAFQPSQIPLF